MRCLVPVQWARFTLTRVGKYFYSEKCVKDGSVNVSTHVVPSPCPAGTLYSYLHQYSINLPSGAQNCKPTIVKAEFQIG